jgi:uncharacterized protein (TIGR03086 family)
VTVLDDLATAEHHLAGVVNRIDSTTAANPTPCAGWDVRALLVHTLASSQLFASTIDGVSPPSGAAMGGDAADLGDPAAATAAALKRSRAAWTSLTDLDQVLATPFGEMPARQLAAIATFSAVVHGWDLAAALGAPRAIPAHLLDVVRPVAEFVVPVLRPAGAFGDPDPVAADATPTEVFIASLGRDPRWSP